MSQYSRMGKMHASSLWVSAMQIRTHNEGCCAPKGLKVWLSSNIWNSIRHRHQTWALALGIGRASAWQVTKCLGISKQDGKSAWAWGPGLALGIGLRQGISTAIYKVPWHWQTDRNWYQQYLLVRSLQQEHCIYVHEINLHYSLSIISSKPGNQVSST